MKNQIHFIETEKHNNDYDKYLDSESEIEKQ